MDKQEMTTREIGGISVPVYSMENRSLNNKIRTYKVIDVSLLFEPQIVKDNKVKGDEDLFTGIIETDDYIKLTAPAFSGLENVIKYLIYFGLNKASMQIQIYNDDPNSNIRNIDISERYAFFQRLFNTYKGEFDYNLLQAIQGYYGNPEKEDVILVSKKDNFIDIHLLGSPDVCITLQVNN